MKLGNLREGDDAERGLKCGSGEDRRVEMYGFFSNPRSESWGGGVTEMVFRDHGVEFFVFEVVREVPSVVSNDTLPNESTSISIPNQAAIGPLLDRYWTTVTVDRRFCHCYASCR